MKTILEYLSTKVTQTKIKATDDTIQQIVKDELDRLGHDAGLNHIDVSEVTDMHGLFCCHNDYLGLEYADLNPDISKWDVSKVTNMAIMFWNCKKLDCDISEFDVSKVTNMKHMFYYCENFNQNLSKWNVSNVEDMNFMFYGCKKFNKDISSWDVSNVIYMQEMFYDCNKFNQDLSKWNVVKVKKNNYMFDGCPIREEFKPKFK